MHDELWESLRQRWIVEGVRPAPGVSEAEIVVFENRYGIRLPEDLRAYLLAMDGMWDGYWDDGFNRFWPLEEIHPLSEDWQDRWDADESSSGEYIGKGVHEIVTFSEAKSLFLFADHSWQVVTYAIRLSADPRTPTPVFALWMDYPGPCSRDPSPAAPSFRALVEQYLSLEEGTPLV